MIRFLLATAAILGLTLNVMAEEDITLTIEKEADTVILEPRLPLNELRVFAEAFNRISSAYVEEIDDKTLLENAIKGMLSQMDPHSSYLDKDSFNDLQESTSGNYGGLGIELSHIHISEPTRPERISYALFCLKKKNMTCCA